MRNSIVRGALVTACAAAALGVAAPAAFAAKQPPFRAGAAVADITPPTHGSLQNDAADCDPSGSFDGTRGFAFEEPYQDQQGSGHYDPGDPYVDCNHNGRWDGNLIGGGADTPRFYSKVADPVTARALVVGNGSRTIAVEAIDNEGLFNTYAARIRDKVKSDGFDLDGIFISSTHDESAPDTIGLGGVTPATSGTNAYYVDFLVERAAKAIEQAYAQMRPASVRYSEAIQPANLRQCWSSYPYTDDQLMPTLQAVDSSGHTIVTLASVSQHAETLGFNSDPEQRTWLSGDWPHFFRHSLEQRYGGVGIEMAGSVGSVETPQVFDQPISRVPQRHHDASHPAGCRTIFDENGTAAPLGYDQETKALGEQLATAVGNAIDASARPSKSSEIWGARADACVPLSNSLFAAAAAGGVFAERPGYTANCAVESPVAPNGSTSGDEIKTQVAAFQIGDGSFISVPGEVFPFTYLRGFQGPDDMPKPQYPLPPWLLPHMHTPFRFVDGLAEDMIGYIFPRGNGVGVPGEDPTGNPTADGSDRFGCGHSDDSESANSQAGDIVGDALVQLLDSRGQPEKIVQGRYAMKDGSLSRDPLGHPEVKCDVDQTFDPSTGPATAVWVDGTGVVRPAAWMSLSGRRQEAPDRNTRGFFTKSGERRWLEVFQDLPNAPARVPAR